MQNLTYAWKRYWISRGSSFTPDDGYLLDPDSKWGEQFNPNAISFERIADCECLVLLGEPGIGKSKEIDQHWQIVEKESKEKGSIILKFDLRDYQTDIMLHRDIFEHPEFLSWLRGNHQLYLFLDSLDEGLLAINPLATLLVKELKNCPIERLFLRITCRTAEWPTILENGLNDLWKQEKVKIYELLPLRRIDVKTAAEAQGLDGDLFLEEINRKGASPLASKPISLNLLLRLYLKHKNFPLTRIELYFEGCKLLCDEQNGSRIVSRRVGNLTADQRLQIAARIAAVTIISNKSAINLARNSGNIVDGDVTVKDLSGAQEIANGERFSINETAIRETLTTGLFNSRGSERMGWVHQTYAEFLAAWYLNQRGMKLKQKLDLIFHQGELDRKLVPQLHETSAWLAGIDTDVFYEIMKTDPEVLLRSDVTNKNSQDQEQLVETYLRLVNEDKLINYRYSFNNYRNLCHPSLAKQLRLYIKDNTNKLDARRIAIDIAEACNLTEIQNELIEIALSNTGPLELRIDAAQALTKIGDLTVKEKLKPLIKSGPDDPDEDLKGYALKAVWPNSITVEELFAVLTPTSQGYYGSYEGFISDHLVQHLSLSDLPVALEWVTEQPSKDIVTGASSDLINSIMLKGWENLDELNILESFTKAVLSRLSRFDTVVSDKRTAIDVFKGTPTLPGFNSSVEKEDIKRRKVLTKLVERLPQPDKNWVLLSSYRNPFLLEKDFSWLINQLELSLSVATGMIWAELIRGFVTWAKPDIINILFKAIQSNPSLANIFPYFGRSVDLNSTEAKEMKEQYLKNQRQAKAKPLPITPSPAERILKLLDEFESGDNSAWWQLNWVMFFSSDGWMQATEDHPDLTSLPGWKTADDTTRSRIINAAKRYVITENPGSYDWLKKSNYTYRPAFAGYRALYLLFLQSPDFISTIPPTAWKNWAPMILAFSSTSNNKSTEIQRQLIKLAYQSANNQVIDALRIIIDKENRENGQLDITDKIENCWDDDIAKVFLDKLKSKNVKLGTLGCLLSILLAHNVSAARIFAESLIVIPPPFSRTVLPKAIESAKQLILNTDDLGWSIIWPILQNDNKFGKKLVETISYSERRVAKIAKTLEEKDLADLFIWLAQNYQYKDDPKYPKGYSFELIDYEVTTRKSVIGWRNSILEQLRERGTIKACEEIKRIMRTFPELEWMKRTLLTAQETTRRKTWAPPEPVTILNLASNPELGLVQSGDQLLDLVIESLKRLEKRLQENTPAAIDLWNENEGIYRPKDENRLSDYIKRYLDEDLKQRGIVINREVEIRRGERTDIHIDAIKKRSDGEVYDKISIIIEVKGSWNKHVKQSMGIQLVDRYLKNNRCNYGIYLVGWFNCSLWDPKDYRKKQSPKLSLHKAREFFDVQALQLTNGAKVIKAFILNTSIRNEEGAKRDI
jgi:predicted NACHT family NTPase